MGKKRKREVMMCMSCPFYMADYFMPMLIAQAKRAGYVVTSTESREMTEKDKAECIKHGDDAPGDWFIAVYGEEQ
ncbi:MAG: hypothetical protein IKZ44_06910 [Clostridia bacterium]|nr:hypothetical protein [Clostridia bacterium]